MSFSCSHCCFLSLPFMASEIKCREDECRGRAKKMVDKWVSLSRRSHGNKRKNKPFLPMQQTELWVNNCSAQSMCNTKIHFQHLWHCNIRLKRLLTAMWISSTVVACRDLWSNQVVASIRASGQCWFYNSPNSTGRGVMQAFWGTCFVMLAQGQFGRIIRDSIRMTDVNLIQVPKRWLLSMVPWPYLHNMLLIMHAACTRSVCFAVVFVLLFFFNLGNIWWDRGGLKMCKGVTEDRWYYVWDLHVSCTKLRYCGSSDVKEMCFLIFPIIPVYFRSMNPLLRIFQ